ncbi:unnamed protein product [marine sediment metagenome]|uniref:Uncharacterized protein n=1 Tax=marine sediment metagenome TaxID=412755 RepID=X1M6U9_9ZZZZ
MVLLSSRLMFVYAQVPISQVKSQTARKYAIALFIFLLDVSSLLSAHGRIAPGLRVLYGLVVALIPRSLLHLLDIGHFEQLETQ